MPSARVEVDGVGFLSDEVAGQLRRRPGINRQLATVVTDTLRYANELATSLPVLTPPNTVDEKQRVISLVLFVRLIEIFEAVVVLAASGVREEQRTLFRVFLDAYFLLANCCSDVGFFPVYFRSDQCERLKLMRAASRYNDDLFATLNEYATAEVKSGIEERIKEESIQAFNSFVYAQNVGCEKIYDSMYRVCSSSVHSAPRCLENYVQTDVAGNIVGVLHREDSEATNRVLYDCEGFFLKGIHGILELFESQELTFVTRFEAALEAAGHETKP